MLDFLSAVGGILFLDIVLSGDNAFVIGAAAAGLPRRRRWWAIATGGAGAIILRIAFTSLASTILNLLWIQTLGAFVLLFLAGRLLIDRHTDVNVQRESRDNSAAKSGQTDQQSFFAAMLTIIIADVTMSLDNILAVGALANGNFCVLAIGVFLSIVLLMLGSAFVATLIERFTWLLDGAALILAWTSATMILSDLHQSGVLDTIPWARFALPILLVSIVIAIDLFVRYNPNRT